MHADNKATYDVVNTLKAEGFTSAEGTDAGRHSYLLMDSPSGEAAMLRTTRRPGAEWELLTRGPSRRVTEAYLDATTERGAMRAGYGALRSKQDKHPSDQRNGGDK